LNEVVDEITFAPLTRGDFELVSAWLAEPRVERWWHDDPSPAGVEAQYGPSIDGLDPTQVYIAMLDAIPIGLIQRYRLDDEPDFGAELQAAYPLPPGVISMDYFIASEQLRGNGLGPRIIAALVDDTWTSYPDAPAIVIPVAAANRASWRALERAGFRRVGEGMLTPDNPIDPPDHVIYRVDRSTRSR
jgi:aminoglycoside 6'-N-acetyltransferase